MEVTFRTDVSPSVEQIITLYRDAGLPRPIGDRARIQTMFENSDLIVTAWAGEELIGICRCITDWVWACYLSDLAISPEFKQKGIGKKLIDVTKERVGEQTMILLLSVPTAMEYYPKVGFNKEDRAFSIDRKK